MPDFQVSATITETYLASSDRQVDLTKGVIPKALLKTSN